MNHLINNDNTCCFSGYRPEKLPWRTDEQDPRCAALKARIRGACAAAYASGIRHFICGMARGSDMYFLEAVFQLQEQFPDITTEAAIPCETQAAGWTEAERDRYFGLIEKCDLESMISRAYTKDCMIRRNKYMVDHASLLIAVYDGTLGGTMQTVHYAQKKGLEVVILPPVPETQSRTE